MTHVFFDVEFSEPNAACGTGGGWIIPTVFRLTSQGKARISPHFENLAQLDRQIDQMKADLEEVRNIARQKFPTVIQRTGAAARPDSESGKSFQPPPTSAKWPV